MGAGAQVLISGLATVAAHALVLLATFPERSPFHTDWWLVIVASILVLSFVAGAICVTVRRPLGAGILGGTALCIAGHVFFLVLLLNGISS